VALTSETSEVQLDWDMEAVIDGGGPTVGKLGDAGDSDMEELGDAGDSDMEELGDAGDSSMGEATCGCTEQCVRQWSEPKET
jgi:hypothetical protein